MRADRGQATVEFALVLPIVLLVVLGCLQVTQVLVEQVRLVHVVRDAARAASISSEPSVAVRSVRGADHVEFDVLETSGLLTITGRLRIPTEVPLIGDLLPDITLRERLVIHAESFP